MKVAAGLAVAVLIAAGGGVALGHEVWRNSSPAALTAPSTTLPSGSSGGTLPSGSSPFGSNPFGSGTGGTGTGGTGSGTGSAASGSPAAAASIAKHVDPGLVDINTTLSYQSAAAAGTGMVLTSNGEVLTNNHVVEGATSISVTDIGNGKTYSAKVVGYDRSQDIAVLQLISASGLQTVNLGNSSTVQVGEGVVAIGNANGAGGTPSYAGGAVTATNQSITATDDVGGNAEQLSGLIENNADVIPGDSGGPLVNSAGQVLGMDTAGSSSFQFEARANQSYAIPIDEAVSIADQIVSGTASSTVHVGATAFLGIEVEGSGFGSTSSASGVVISAVVSGGAAAQAGLSAGDTITSLSGQTIMSSSSLTTVMLSERPGTSAQLTYLDPSGQSHTTTVTFGSGPAQ
jgi:S1-C subfamily serine protease